MAAWSRRAPSNPNPNPNLNPNPNPNPHPNPNPNQVSQSAFTPMLPGDEQLVPYGEDSTLSVVRGVTQASAVSAVS